MDRYTRQSILEEIGDEGQKRLSESSVLCIGAGGLGCPALLYLVAAGVGKIGVADFDNVDESNLQRQILFTTKQVGQNKAVAAKERLNALNPDIRIEIYEEGLHEKNAEALFKGYDIIIDGTDNFATKYLINDAGAKFSKPVIYGALNKFEGQASVFDAQRGACYRCLHPTPPEGHIPNCAEAGVIGAVAGIVGTTQAMETIKLIIAHENFKPLIGTLFYIDMRDMRTRSLFIPKDKNCPTCSKEPHEITLPRNTKEKPCTMIKNITINEMPDHKDALLIDVREQDEWDAGYIEGATLIPLSALLEGKIPDLPHDQDILIYCRSGKRSMTAAQILQAKGYKRLMNLSGGYLEWSAAA